MKSDQFNQNLPIYALLAIVGIVALFTLVYLSLGSSSVALTSSSEQNLAGNAYSPLSVIAAPSLQEYTGVASERFFCSYTCPSGHAIELNPCISLDLAPSKRDIRVSCSRMGLSESYTFFEQLKHEIRSSVPSDE